ncbi:MAG: twin transmembrane helix small protein [Alphaproteobacteria bacterium]
MIQTLLPSLLAIAALAVLASLFAGLAFMARGGEANARWSNRLMRARVASQAAALLLIALYFLLPRLG